MGAVPYTIPETIQIAKICQVLASQDVRAADFYNKKPTDPRLPQMLYMERKAIEWYYTYGSSAQFMNDMANYLLALCWPYLQKALVIIDNIALGAPVITGPNSISVTAGQNASFSVAVTGSSPFSYQWYDSLGNPISGATSSVYTLSNAQLSDSGKTFYVKVVDSNGKTATSSIATLTVTSATVVRVYYGDTDYSADLESGVDNVPYIFSLTVTPGNPFPIQFPEAISAKYIVIQYPDTEPTKNHFDNPPVDNGPIPGFVFEINAFNSKKYVFSRSGNPFTVNPSNLITISTV